MNLQQLVDYSSPLPKRRRTSVSSSVASSPAKADSGPATKPYLSTTQTSHSPSNTPLSPTKRKGRLTRDKPYVPQPAPIQDPKALPIGATLAPPNPQQVNLYYNAAVSRLGTFASLAQSRLLNAPDWSSFVRQEHGPSHIKSEVLHLPHPAGPYLSLLSSAGVPIQFDDPDWSLEQRDAAMTRGCHFSATKHKEFIAEEMLEFADAGYWTILPYEAVRHLPNLRLSPAQIKEERERKPRFIADHTFYHINDHTLALAPKEAMQFGGALYRILTAARHANPLFGPVKGMKLDLKDGYYKVGLRPRDALALAVILPSYPGLPPLVAVPLALTMGWINSPPLFCAMSETICDRANSMLYKRHAPPHRLEELAGCQDQT